MRATVVVAAAASALAIASAVTNSATAAPKTGGSWAFSDYTPDPASLLADQMLHVATGQTVVSHCSGSRVPSAPQDVNSHTLKVTRAAVLVVTADPTGAWGFDVNDSRGKTLSGAVTTPTGTAQLPLRVRLRPGTYSVTGCNLGGAPTAQATYQLTTGR